MKLDTLFIKNMFEQNQNSAKVKFAKTYNDFQFRGVLKGVPGVVLAPDSVQRFEKMSPNIKYKSEKSDKNLEKSEISEGKI